MIGREILPCDSVVLAVGQDNAFPWIERNIGLEFGKWDMPVVDKTTFMSTRPGVFFGGDAAFGPANIIWAVEHGHQAAISIHNYCQGIPVTERPPQGMTLTSTKMGLHEWAYSNNYNTAERQKMDARRTAGALRQHDDGSGEGIHRGADAGRGRAMPELRHGDALHSVAVHRVRRVHRHLPGRLPGDQRQRRRALPPRTVQRPGAEPEQPLYVSESLKQTQRVMLKDENICLHCGLCAERCPTYAWDMRQFVLKIPYAGASGEGDTACCGVTC